MNNFLTIDQKKPTYSPFTKATIIVGICGSAVASGATLPNLPYRDIENSNVHVVSQLLSTSNPASYKSPFTGDYVFAELSLDAQIEKFYSNLLGSQEPLGKEFEKVLYDNLWELYET